jgi:hypothetical protein
METHKRKKGLKTYWKHLSFLGVVVVALAAFFVFFPMNDPTGYSTKGVNPELASESVDQNAEQSTAVAENSESSGTSQSSGTQSQQQVQEKQLTPEEKAATEFANEISSLIGEVLELRENSDLVRTAQIVTRLDSHQLMGSPVLKSAWQKLVGCAYDGCDDSAYLDMIETLCLLQPNANTVLIHSLIENYKLWDGKNVVDFSESLTRTNQLVAQRSESIRNKWSDIVGCNAECSTFNDKMFDFIEAVVS